MFNIKTGVAIIILIKDGSDEHNIYYNEVPDFMNKNDKLRYLSKISLLESFNLIKPSDSNDWINQRDSKFQSMMEINKFFGFVAPGVSTNRDKWVIGFSKNELIKNVKKQ
ncbi:hypothetical protein ACWODI_04255 [Facklamia languida]